jgi:hypothetical protein
VQGGLAPPGRALVITLPSPVRVKLFISEAVPSVTEDKASPIDTGRGHFTLKGIKVIHPDDRIRGTVNRQKSCRVLHPSDRNLG